eukprot:scaffold3596_cov126-Cylindrotheca_fusiformis.AAC.2
MRLPSSFRIALAFAFVWCDCQCFLVLDGQKKRPSAQFLRHHHESSSIRLQMNLISDMLGGGGFFSKLEPQDSLPYSPEVCPTHSCSNDVRTFAVQERWLSFTGEDFDVVEAIEGGGSRPFVKVRGAMMHLPGKDKMRLFNAKTGDELLVLDRKLVAATPTYDIYRGGWNAEKIGWMEKKMISFTDTFDVYMEGKGGFGVTGLFKPNPAYRITGDFLDRNFVIRNDQGQCVAVVREDWIVELDSFNHYQVQVAPGMDAVLVLACLCAIDEEFDEEHKEKKKQKS